MSYEEFIAPFRAKAQTRQQTPPSYEEFITPFRQGTALSAVTESRIPTTKPPEEPQPWGRPVSAGELFGKPSIPLKPGYATGYTAEELQAGRPRAGQLPPETKPSRYLTPEELQKTYPLMKPEERERIMAEEPAFESRIREYERTAGELRRKILETAAVPFRPFEAAYQGFYRQMKALKEGKGYPQAEAEARRVQAQAMIPEIFGRDELERDVFYKILEETGASPTEQAVIGIGAFLAEITAMPGAPVMGWGRTYRPILTAGEKASVLSQRFGLPMGESARWLRTGKIPQQIINSYRTVVRRLMEVPGLIIRTPDEYFAYLIRSGKTAEEAKQLTAKLYPKVKMETFMKPVIPTQELMQAELGLQARFGTAKLTPEMREISLLEDSLARRKGVTAQDISAKYGQGLTDPQYLTKLRELTKPTKEAKATAELFPQAPPPVAEMPKTGGLPPEMPTKAAGIAPTTQRLEAGRPITLPPEGMYPRPPVPEEFAQPPPYYKVSPRPVKYLTAPQQELRQVTGEIQGMRNRIARELWEQDPDVVLAKGIKAQGGLKTTVGLEEEYKLIPMWLRNERGLAGDEMAAHLGMTENELIEKLRQFKMPKIGEYYGPAMDIIEAESPHLFKSHTMLQTLIKAGVGDSPSVIENAQRLSRAIGREVSPERYAQLSAQTEKLEGEMAQVTAEWQKGLATAEQKKQVHTLAKKLNFNATEYRDFLRDLTGKTSMSPLIKDPMTKEEARQAIEILGAMVKELPTLATRGQKQAVLKIMERKKLTVPQVRRLEKLFGVRMKSSEPLLTEQAADLIEAMQKVPFRGRPPVISRGLPQVTDEMRAMPDIKQGFITPTPQWMEKIGPTAVDNFLWPVIETDIKITKVKQLFNGNFNKLLSELGIKHANSRRIGTYLAGLDPEGQIILQKMGITETPVLTGKEMELAQRIRLGFENMHREINALRERLGMKPLGYVQNYYTLLQKMTLADRLGISWIGRDATQRIAGIKLIAPRFRFGIERIGGMPAIELDAAKVYQTYMDTAINHLLWGDTIAKGQDLATALKPTHPNLSASLKNWYNFIAVNGRPSTSSSETLDYLLGGLRKNVYTAVLAGNAKSVINQTASFTLLYAKADHSSIAKGLYRLASGRDVSKFSKILLPRQADLAFEELGRDIFTIWAKGRKKIADIGTLPMKKVDQGVAAVVYNVMYEDGLKRGIKGAEAYKFADIETAKIMATPRPWAIAPIQRSEIGRSVSMFNTVILSEFSTVWSDIIKKSLTKEGAILLGKYITAIGIYNALMEDYLGVPSIFPRPIKTIRDALEEGKKDTPEIIVDVAMDLGQQLPIIGGSLRMGGRGKGLDIATGGPIPQLINDTIAFKSTKKREGIAAPKFWADAVSLAGRWLGMGGAAQADKVLTEMERRYNKWYQGRYAMDTWSSFRRAIWGSLGEEEEKRRAEPRVPQAPSLYEKMIKQYQKGGAGEGADYEKMIKKYRQAQ